MQRIKEWADRKLELDWQNVEQQIFKSLEGSEA